ncbi:putative ribonuclease H-like domain-containing protein [Tanacetum coccineum]
MIDYSLWEVIKNGNKVLKITVGTVKQEYEPTTAKEKQDRRNEIKAGATVLMALPNKDQLKFHSYQDAKLLMEAVKKRYGGNHEIQEGSKDTSQATLEIQGEVINQEDMNLKLLRSLPSEWKTHALIWRNKVEIETISLDDLYNNLKIYEQEITGSASTSQNPQKCGFWYGVNTTSLDNLCNAVICAFLACQPNSPQLAQEDLEQLHPDDLKEMDLQWEMAMLTIKARRFIKRTCRKLDINGQRVGFDKSKVKCYNCHKHGHFARECRFLRNQENKGRENNSRTITVETPTQNALIAQDGIGGYDWSYQAKEEQLYQNLCIDAFNFRKFFYQVIDKFKIGLGYNAATAATPANSSTATLPVLTYIKSFTIYFPTPSNDKTVKSNTVRINNSSAPIIEDWNSDDESEVDYIQAVKNTTIRPSTDKIKFVKTATETVVRPVWNNSRRVKKKNFTNKLTHPHPKRSFVPQAVLTMSRKVNNAGVAVNTARPVNTANTKAVNTVRIVNTANTRTVNTAASTSIDNPQLVVFNTAKQEKAMVPQSGGPPIKVSDEAVNKELGDRMERAATTAFSFEAKQGNDAQTRFEAASKSQMTHLSQEVTHLEVGRTVMIVNEERQIQALVDKKKVIITETSIRRDLKLDDAAVFLDKQVEGIGKHKEIFVISSHTKKVFANMRRQADGFSGRVIPLFDTMMVQVNQEEVPLPTHEIPIKESMSTPSNDPQPSGEDCFQLNELMVFCTSLQKQVLDLEKAKNAQAKEIVTLKKRVKKLERKRRSRPTGLRRFRKGRSDDADMFDTDALIGNEVFADKDMAEKDHDVIPKKVSTGEILTTAGITIPVSTSKVVSTAEIKTSTASSTAAVSPPVITEVEITLAQTLTELKSTKSNVVMQESEKSTTTPIAATTVTTTIVTMPKTKGVVIQEPSETTTRKTIAQPPTSKDKGKVIMIEPKKPLKRKDQIAADEELARQLEVDLQAEIAEEERLRMQKEEEANIALIES